MEYLMEELLLLKLKGCSCTERQLTRDKKIKLYYFLNSVDRSLPSKRKEIYVRRSRMRDGAASLLIAMRLRGIFEFSQ